MAILKKVKKVFHCPASVGLLMMSVNIQKVLLFQFLDRNLLRFLSDFRLYCFMMHQMREYMFLRVFSTPVYINSPFQMCKMYSSWILSCLLITSQMISLLFSLQDTGLHCFLRNFE